NKYFVCPIVDEDRIGICDPGLGTLDIAHRIFISLSRSAVDADLIDMFGSDVQFVVIGIQEYAARSMRNGQVPYGSQISVGVDGKYAQILTVARDRIHFLVFRR